MFLKNKNIIFKIRKSKVTDCAALKLSTGAKSNNTKNYYAAAHHILIKNILGFRLKSTKGIEPKLTNLNPALHNFISFAPLSACKIVAKILKIMK